MKHKQHKYILPKYISVTICHETVRETNILNLTFVFGLFYIKPHCHPKQEEVKKSHICTKTMQSLHKAQHLND